MQPLSSLLIVDTSRAIMKSFCCVPAGLFICAFVPEVALSVATLTKVIPPPEPDSDRVVYVESAVCMLSKLVIVPKSEDESTSEVSLSTASSALPLPWLFSQKSTNIGYSRIIIGC